MHHFAKPQKGKGLDTSFASSPYCTEAVLSPQPATRSLGKLVKQRLLAPAHSFWFSPWWSPQICIFSKFPNDTNAFGQAVKLQNTSQVPLWTHCLSCPFCSSRVFHLTAACPALSSLAPAALAFHCPVRKSAKHQQLFNCILSESFLIIYFFTGHVPILSFLSISPALSFWYFQLHIKNGWTNKKNRLFFSLIFLYH